MRRSLLVTGGAGFIGANFVHYWIKVHPEDRVTVLDALTYAGNAANLAPVAGSSALDFVRGDICDADLTARLLVERRIDTIVHFAAETHVDRSIHAPDPFLQTNVIGTHVLLKAARSAWRMEDGYGPSVRFHHVSTDEVYGSLAPDDPAFTEQTAYAPNSPYAASKAASDHLVRAYHRTFGLPVTTSNCSNNYGPYQFPEKLIPLLLINALEGKSLPIYGDGLNVRDWLFVEDHCRAIEAILERGVVGETYNIGGGAELPNLHVVGLLSRLIDEAFQDDPGLAGSFPSSPPARGGLTESLVKFVPDRPGHDRRYAMDGSKIARELGFHPRESLESGLRRTIAWYLREQAWWRAVMDGSYRAWISTQYGGGAA
jgi:dTDP-glucose 4,6-dehydratase